MRDRRVELGLERHVVMALAEALCSDRIALTAPHQAELGALDDVAHDVRTPVAVTDDRHADGSGDHLASLESNVGQTQAHAGAAVAVLSIKRVERALACGSARNCCLLVELTVNRIR